MITQETLDILVENRLNDSKIWYEQQKPEIKRLVIEPFFEIIEELAPTMLNIDGEMIVEPKVDRTLSRIYRDTRFFKDKTRYRDSVWLHFNRDKNLYPGYPGFFFELKPIFAWWGCGFYPVDSAMTESYRKMILDRDLIFMQAKEAVDYQLIDAKSTFVLDDMDKYKRTKYPQEPEEYRNWLDRKAVYLVHTEPDPTAVFTDDLAKRLAEDFKSLIPLYRFMCAAYDRSVTPERVRRRRR